ncbi:MAG: NAD(P)(+) transhydrogenase (Re/Si-specific) subunit alpha [Henriciella sp.]|jgi:NAD(P) transhydrogenase subunit alpha|uniref:Re/Si-specific NAD(P)(+) transhydrogenase subunit alpha n=1 Tax=Henriciella sp. TaxID=1968823 RepID=UPI000C111483|nr:Re/Si-specific NAD(P)(+) transhydrogenase subunit alpha [Henriciella sp.]MAN73718.1 NAD(P)(+) transhydrogenase (Re/Si-specific) subunit alpha [Henriciella sp.]PHR75321.1 MAG: NAD(P)(+) transhydrogenase (Re/Si-specific) subunit alpha [Henriciella sp.]|tara:strand:- start:548 stop:1675 length:1128 start_codon:yes stop_codon:yes gene_type:complete
MKLTILKETSPGETRVAATPESVKKLVGLDHTVTIETGAGVAAGFPDKAFSDEGATIASSASEALNGADLLMKVRAPSAEESASYPEGLTVIALMNPFGMGDLADAFNAKKLNTLAMEFTPRITRAQSMDALSSQSNLAGYRAMIEGAALYGRALPMMMTAAGTVAPAKVFVMGAGVAGLQAIATARRLGGVVTATDVRPAAKEQVASLGAKFIAVENEEFKEAETAGGYAKEMSDDYKKQQAELTATHIAKQDIVITTALIPGRPAPELVTEDMVKAMKPGAVIIDMAVATGGNCKLSKPDEVVDVNGVKVAGFSNLPARLPADTSSLYAKNLVAFLPLITAEDGSLNLETDDEIVTAMILTKGGETVNERLKS